MRYLKYVFTLLTILLLVLFANSHSPLETLILLLLLGVIGLTGDYRSVLVLGTAMLFPASIDVSGNEVIALCGQYVPWIAEFAATYANYHPGLILAFILFVVGKFVGHFIAHALAE